MGLWFGFRRVGGMVGVWKSEVDGWGGSDSVEDIVVVVVRGEDRKVGVKGFIIFFWNVSFV